MKFTPRHKMFWVELISDNWSLSAYSVDNFLRATAVPAGTAEARISYGDSVRLSVRPSVCRNPVQKQPCEIETPGLYHMIA